ncbi:MAG: hypothetical protein ACREEE_06890 [Dongiaceae bacterium]
MSEISFVIEEAPEGGLTARALGESIFTEAGSMQELRTAIRSAVQCHFDAADMPKIIRPSGHGLSRRSLRMSRTI